jgi:hypothetical protein
MILFVVLVVICCLLPSEAISFAQARRAPASLQVTVVDATGAALVGATVDVSAPGAATVLRTSPTDINGRATFQRLPPGEYVVHVLLSGFTDVQRPNVTLRPGTNRLDVTLQIASLTSSVTVTPDARAAAINPNGDSMSTTLGEDALDALPEDESDLQQVLTELAGAGAELSVNGFVGADVPPKSEIQQIRIRRNVFSADRHGRGGSRIEIITRPGTQAWRSTMSVGFRDESLNARNAFATTRPPERTGRGRLSVQGPLVKGQTSLALFVQGVSAYDSAIVHAATPTGLFSGVLKQPRQQRRVSVRLEQALGPANLLRLDYRDSRNDDDNLGVGDFNLPEHAYAETDTSHRFRASTSGSLWKGSYNDLALQVRWDGSTIDPSTTGPAIRVLDTMTAGGATSSGRVTSREINLQEKLDYTRGAHAFSVGGQMQWEHDDSSQIDNGNGTFTFSTLADYEAGRPNTFTQWIGDPSVAFPSFQGGWFVGDDITLSKALLVSLGLRNEWQAHLGGVWHPAPRLGATWAPSADGRTTIRGGFGVFHDWYDASTYEETLQTDGTRGQEISIESPGYPDPFAGGESVVLPAGRVQQSPDLKMPTVRQSTVAIERRLGAGIRVNATYTHRSGHDLLRGRNLNAPDPDGVRPDPQVGNLIEIRSVGRMREDQLHTSVSGRLPWRRAFLSLRYTLGKSLDDGSGPTWLPADPANPEAEWGPASDDRRHELSFFGAADVLPSVQAGVTLRAQSAPPYTITTGEDDNGDTVFNDRPSGVGRNTARGSGMFRLDLRLTYRLGIGDPATTGDGGGAQRPPRGRDRGGNWRTEHRAMVEFYVRANNVLNNVNFTGYRGALTSPFFGQPTSAQSARQIEIGTMVMF